jgi:hypothetical protein
MAPIAARRLARRTCVDEDREQVVQDLPCIPSRAHERSGMVSMVLNVEVADYDEWKRLFDSDPGGRKAVAKGHTVSRNVENPNDIFIRTEYASVEDAKKVRQQLLDSGALNTSTVKTPPTIIETADQATY